MDSSCDVIKHSSVMDDLKLHHKTIFSLIGQRPVHYLDLPMHGNVGDLLIMAGTLRFFFENNITVQRKAMYFNYDESCAPSGAALVFHGGGNFGDIYGPFQSFRERVIAVRKDCRIIILPQTIHFSFQENFELTKEILSAHPDLHICVRDENSRQSALQFTKNVYLMPDMAHQLWPLRSEHIGSDGTLELRRRDSEKCLQQNSSIDGAFDWDDLIHPAYRFFLSRFVERLVTQFTIRLGASRLFGNWFAEIWIKEANRFINEATKLFSKYNCVNSDRLHAHILACLLSKRNIISDNSYGKNGNYIKQWTFPSPLVTLVDKKSGE